LLQIAGMVRAGEDVQIIDNSTKEDKTEVTLALIISEELKSQPRSVPLGTLRDLIHQRGEKLLSHLREGPIGRLIPGVTEDRQDATSESPVLDPVLQGGDPPSDAVAGPSAGPEARPSGAPEGGAAKTELSSFEQWRHAIDERIRMILPSIVGFRDLQQKLEQVTQRVTKLEAELARRDPKE
jgi:hypothetical protein